MASMNVLRERQILQHNAEVWFANQPNDIRRSINEAVQQEYEAQPDIPPDVGYGKEGEMRFQIQRRIITKTYLQFYPAAGLLPARGPGED